LRLGLRVGLDRAGAQSHGYPAMAGGDRRWETGPTERAHLAARRGERAGHPVPVDAKLTCTWT